MAERKYRQIKKLKNLLKLTDDRDPETKEYAVQSMSSCYVIISTVLIVAEDITE